MRIAAWKRGAVFTGTAITVLLLCSGCGLTYLLHAISGELRLLNNAVPLETALQEDGLRPEERYRLRLVRRIKAFGEKDLGLRKTHSYETVYMASSRRPLYVVSAAPRDRLRPVTWWFPVVGRMPYLGFFDRDRAWKEKERLEKKGLDTLMSRADAFSTLGWFGDPLTLNLVKGGTVDLAETLLHEMTHATLYVRGEGEFNEGLAVLVGMTGAFRFFRKILGETHPFTLEAKRSIHDERLFSEFLSGLLARLDRLYRSPVSYREKMTGRERIFADALRDFARLESRFETRRYSGFGRGGLNNAYLLTVGLYHRNFNLFEAVLEKNGNSIRKTLQFFRRLAGEPGGMLEKTRKRLGWTRAAGPRIPQEAGGGKCRSTKDRMASGYRGVRLQSLWPASGPT